MPRCLDTFPVMRPAAAVSMEDDDCLEHGVGPRDTQSSFLATGSNTFSLRDSESSVLAAGIKKAGLQALRPTCRAYNLKT